MGDPIDPSSHLRVVPLHDRSGLLERVGSQPDSIRTRFAPIADLKGGVAAGYEVLLSVGGDEALAPRRWSQEVHTQVVGQLEAALVCAALTARERLPTDAQLAINVSAGALRSADLRSVLGDAGSLEQVTVMVTEDA